MRDDRSCIQAQGNQGRFREHVNCRCLEIKGFPKVEVAATVGRQNFTGYSLPENQNANNDV